MSNYVLVTYVRSIIACPKPQRRTIKALGFKKLNESRIFELTPSVAGMLRKVSHLLHIEQVEVRDISGEDSDDKSGEYEIIPAQSEDKA